MRIGGTGAAFVGFGVGLVMMVLASIWAPAQPEVWMDGGACEVDVCGALEDPSRWRAAWVLWLVGALCTLAATVAHARPRPGTALLRAGLAALALCCLPIVVIVAYLTSLGTSAQGFATVVWLFTAVPLVATATPTLRGLTRRAHLTRRGRA